MTETYYDLLGVSAEASTAEIEAAYRERLKETHPDLSDRADASEATQRVIRAKEILTDETERERYDRLGHQAYVAGEGGPSRSSNATPSSSAAAAARRAGWGSGGSRSSGSDPDERTRTDPRTSHDRTARERAARERVSGERSRSSRRDGTDADDPAGDDAGTPGSDERRSSASAGDTANGQQGTERSAGTNAGADAASGAPSGGATSGGANTNRQSGASNATDRRPGAGARRRSATSAAAARAAVSGSSPPGSGPSAKTPEGVGPAPDPGRAPSWTRPGGYSVRQRQSDGVSSMPIFQTNQAYTLLAVTLFLYPIMLFSTLFEPFPLIFNLVVGLCTLALIGYLQSMPEVGVAVFGFWSLATPLGLIALGVGLLSPIGVVAIAGCVMPFVLSLFTAWALYL